MQASRLQELDLGNSVGSGYVGIFSLSDKAA